MRVRLRLDDSSTSQVLLKNFGVANWVEVGVCLGLLGRQSFLCSRQVSWVLPRDKWCT